MSTSLDLEMLRRVCEMKCSMNSYSSSANEPGGGNEGYPGGQLGYDSRLRDVLAQSASESLLVSNILDLLTVASLISNAPFPPPSVLPWSNREVDQQKNAALPRTSIHTAAKSLHALQKHPARFPTIASPLHNYCPLQKSS